MANTVFTEADIDKVVDLYNKGVPFRGIAGAINKNHCTVQGLIMRLQKSGKLAPRHKLKLQAPADTKVEFFPEGLPIDIDELSKDIRHNENQTKTKELDFIAICEKLETIAKDDFGATRFVEKYSSNETGSAVVIFYDSEGRKRRLVTEGIE